MQGDDQPPTPPLHQESSPTEEGQPNRTAPTTQGPPPVGASTATLRPDAKPFTPGVAAAPAPPYVPQVTVTRAHFDEDGTLVYPARVNTIQNPEMMRQIAEREYQQGYRKSNRRTLPTANNSMLAAVTPAQFAQVTNMMVTMGMIQPNVAQQLTMNMFQPPQPQFAVFSNNGTVAQPVMPAAPAVPAAGAPAATPPPPPPPFGSSGDVVAQQGHMQQSVVPPQPPAPPKYATYNPFEERSLDQLAAGVYLEDDDIPESVVAGVRGILDDDDIDPIALIEQVKRMELTSAAALPSDDDDDMDTVGVPPAAANGFAPLLAIKPAAPAVPKFEFHQQQAVNSQPEPIGPSKAPTYQQHQQQQRQGGGWTAPVQQRYQQQPPNAAPLPPPYRPLITHGAPGALDVDMPPPPPPPPPFAATNHTVAQPTAMPLLPPPNTLQRTSPNAPGLPGSSFVPSLTAKPWAPSSSGLPAYTASLPPQQQVNVSTSSSSNGNTSSVMSMETHDRSMEALRVNADEFFTDDGRRGLASTNINPAVPPTPNLFSLQSLQGVRSTNRMPLQKVVWQTVPFRDGSTWVPLAFTPAVGEEIELHNGFQHYDITRPLTHPHVKLHLHYYICNHCKIDVYPGKINERPADVKLGGVCGDIPALAVAHLIEVITGIKIDAIDMFGNNLGRCNLWLNNPQDVPELIRKFDRRMWMSPVMQSYAVVAQDEDGREYLLWYLECLRTNGPKAVRFPRHLVTCERWIA